MLDLLKGNNPQPPTRRARSTDAPKVSEQDADTEAIIKLSHYPSAQVKKDTQPAIEREDWPAPPATAIVTKNMGWCRDIKRCYCLLNYYIIMIR